MFVWRNDRWPMFHTSRIRSCVIAVVAMVASALVACVVFIAVGWHDLSRQREMNSVPWGEYFEQLNVVAFKTYGVQASLMAAIFIRDGTALNEAQLQDLERQEAELRQRWTLLREHIAPYAALWENVQNKSDIAAVEKFLDNIDQGRKYLQSNNMPAIGAWISEYQKALEALRELSQVVFNEATKQHERYEAAATAVERRTVLTVALGLLAVVFCMVVGYMWLSTREHENHSNKIDAKSKPISTDASHEALKAAQQQEQERRAFISTVTHEMKTPLQSVLAAADRLVQIQRSMNEEASLQLRTIADRLVVAVEQIQVQLKDLKRYATGSPEIGEIRRDAFDPSAWLDDIKALVDGLGEQVSVPVNFRSHIDPEKMVIGDRARLLQVAQNLVANALNHTEKGHIDVVLECVPKEQARNGELACFTLKVSDTGTGISQVDLPHITQPYYRGINSSGKQSSGLGLAIVKAILDRMGGQLDIESDEGQGTLVTASVELPYAAS